MCKQKKGNTQRIGFIVKNSGTYTKSRVQTHPENS